MTNTLNKSIQLTGTTGKDVILTTFANGNTKAVLILAVPEQLVNDSGEKIKKMVWHKVVAWGRMAKDIAVVAKKGCLLKIYGRYNYKSIVTASGKTTDMAELVMTDFIKISKKPKNETGSLFSNG